MSFRNGDVVGRIYVDGRIYFDCFGLRRFGRNFCAQAPVASIALLVMNPPLFFAAYVTLFALMEREAVFGWVQGLFPRLPDAVPQSRVEDVRSRLRMLEGRAARLEARVTAEIKNRGTLVTHTNILGAYKINSFGKEIGPDDIAISCSKDGYKQLRVTRRMGMGTETGIEIECRLQRL